MKLTDPRLWQSANIQDFLFRLHFRDEDINLLHRYKLVGGVQEFIAPSPTRVFGIDISHWNDPVDLSKAKSQGCKFAIIKGCDGSIPTFNFERSKNNAKLNGVQWGVYDWLYPVSKVSALTQATAWWNQVKDDYPPLGIWVDFEWTKYNGVTANPYYTDLQAVLSAFKNLSGRDAGIYSAKGYTDQYLSRDQKWNNYKWWIGNYGVTSPAMPYGVTDWEFWQFTNYLDGKAMGTNTLEADGDYYRGTAEQFAAEYGGSVQEPEPTYPFDGCEEYIEIVNGEKCHVSIIDMTNKKLRVKHFNGSLGYVSKVAKQDNALMVFNGEDYDKNAPIKYYPKSLAYTDGAMYVEQKELQYWMNVSKDNIPSADFKNPPVFWNATSFIRPLAILGELAPDIVNNPTKLEYTEIHACSGLGYRLDGKIVQIIAEGKVDPNTGIAYRGITVPQFANLFIKYKAWFAGQHGGGGDVGKVINGVMVNEPSDPTERAVVQVIEILQGVDMNGTAKEKLGNTSTVREQPSRYGKDTNLRVSPYQTTEFTDIVPCLVLGTYDSPNDKWLKRPDGNYVNYILAGKTYYDILTMPTTDTPPVTDTVTVSVDATITADINGTKYQGVAHIDELNLDKV